MARTSIYRLLAVFLLLLTGAELFACEVLAPDRCETFGNPVGKDQRQNDDDNCICCCAHILICNPFALHLTPEIVGTLEAKPLLEVDREPASIYHPPKA